jgi:hypothetical protein
MEKLENIQLHIVLLHTKFLSRHALSPKRNAAGGLFLWILKVNGRPAYKAPRSTLLVGFYYFHHNSHSRSNAHIGFGGAMSKNDWQEGKRPLQSAGAQGNFMHFCHEWVLTVKTRTWSNPHIKLGTGARCRRNIKKRQRRRGKRRRAALLASAPHGIDACELRPGVYIAAAPHCRRFSHQNDAELRGLDLKQRWRSGIS